MNELSLESFYGGKQGVSPVVKARFKYVSSSYTLIDPEGSQEDLNNRKYVDPAYGAKIKQEKIPLKTEVMDDCFADVSYEDVWYGQLAIIDTTNKRNPNNGKLFRRVLPRTENEVEEGGTLHGEYIGRIVGPSEGYPKIRLGSIKNIKNQISKDRNESASDRAIEYSFPTKDGIVDTDNFEKVAPADLEANKENNQLISGLDNNSIHYSWVNVRNNIDDENQESYVYLGFQIPYTYFDFSFDAIDWKNKSLSQNWDNREDYKNGIQPFYQKRTFGIPRGTKGNGVGFLTRTTFGRFINSGKEGATEILYDFKDLYEESTGKFDIKDYQGNYPQFEEDNLTEDSAILVYTFYMYDSTYDNDNKTKTVTCYFGKITDIENIELDDDGSFRIKYSSGESHTFDKKIKWIKNVELVEPGDRYLTNIPSQLQLKYNDDTIHNIGIIKMIDNIKWEPNDITQLMEMKIQYTTALNNGSNQYSLIQNSGFKSVDGIQIDPDTKEIKYHLWPNYNDYMQFNDHVYLNTIEETFISKDGYLYIRYSSSAKRYTGDIYDEADPGYKPVPRYYYTDKNGIKWCKGGDLPDAVRKQKEEDSWVWWQQLGLVAEKISGIRTSGKFNTERYDAYRKTQGDESEWTWEEFSEADILPLLNSAWLIDNEDGSKKDVNPYQQGHIYIYNLGDNTNFDADWIEDKMGQVLWHEQKSFLFDSQTGKWFYAGPWSSSDASMQLKIVDGGVEFPDKPDIYEKGFFFSADIDKDSEMELTEFWG